MSREIDALVAEKVMGREVWRPEGSAAVMVKVQGAEAYDQCPRYSEDIAAAWQIVEKTDLFELLGNRPIAPDEKPSWSCTIIYPPLLIRGEATAETAPMAICLAALEAAGETLPVDR